MTSMEIKRGYLEPDLVLIVEDVDGLADLNDVDSWRILGRLRGQLVIDAAPGSVVVDGGNTSKATLTRAWETGDTATAGDLVIEVEAMWPGQRPQTFPAVGQVVVRIRADLG